MQINQFIVLRTQDKNKILVEQGKLINYKIGFKKKDKKFKKMILFSLSIFLYFVMHC